MSENEKKYWVRMQNNYNVFPMNPLDELHFVLSLEWSFNTGLTACTSKQIGYFILKVILSYFFQEHKYINKISLLAHLTSLTQKGHVS